MRVKRKTILSLLCAGGIFLAAVTAAAYFLGPVESGITVTTLSDVDDVSAPEYLSMWLEKDQITTKDQEVVVYIKNVSGKDLDYYGPPMLQMRKDGAWYLLEQNKAASTAHIPTLKNGETMSGTLPVERYGTFLPVGEYRLVFGVEGGIRTSVEFDVVK